jgi:Cyclin
LRRIHKYASCSNECFILALIFIDRLIQRNNFLLTELNVHRVVITAILLAAKFFDDAYYNNAYYSKVGGVLVSEMNGLEVDFLFRINFSLHVSPEVFDKYKAELVAHSINCGLVMPSVALTASPLPQIAEVETISNGTSSGKTTPELQFHNTHNYGMQQSQQHKTTCDLAVSMSMHQDPANAAIAAIGRQLISPHQVTPSPSSREMNYLQPVGPLHAPPTSDQLLHATLGGNHCTNPFVFDASSEANITINRAFPEQQAQLYAAPTLNAQHQYQEPLGSYEYGFAVGVAAPPTGYADVGYALTEQQHYQQQQAMIQRAHSLPPLPSGRCIDHARNPPYYSAPPMASMLAPILTVDSEQYNLMMSQLFPIQTTLVHHNHGVADDPPHPHHHHGAVHPGLQGAGIGSLVMHY